MSSWEMLSKSPPSFDVLLCIVVRTLNYWNDVVMQYSASFGP